MQKIKKITTEIALFILFLEVIIVMIMVLIILFGARTASEQEVGQSYYSPGHSPFLVENRDQIYNNSPNWPQIVIATWYNRENCLNCRKDLLTASGIELPEDGMFAAYDNVSLGEYLLVKYQDKFIIVKVIDRIGDPSKIDLLPMAFSSLEDLRVGKVKVEVYKFK